MNLKEFYSKFNPLLTAVEGQFKKQDKVGDDDTAAPLKLFATQIFCFEIRNILTAMTAADFAENEQSKFFDQIEGVLVRYFSCVKRTPLEWNIASDEPINELMEKIAKALPLKKIANNDAKGTKKRRSWLHYLLPTLSLTIPADTLMMLAPEGFKPWHWILGDDGLPLEVKVVAKLIGDEAFESNFNSELTLWIRNVIGNYSQDVIVFIEQYPLANAYQRVQLQRALDVAMNVNQARNLYGDTGRLLLEKNCLTLFLQNMKLVEGMKRFELAARYLLCFNTLNTLTATAVLSSYQDLIISSFGIEKEQYLRGVLISLLEMNKTADINETINKRVLIKFLKSDNSLSDLPDFINRQKLDNGEIFNTDGSSKFLALNNVMGIIAEASKLFCTTELQGALRHE